MTAREMTKYLPKANITAIKWQQTGTMSLCWYSLCAFLSNWKLTSKNTAAVHPLFSMAIFCSMNTWRKKRGRQSYFSRLLDFICFSLRLPFFFLKRCPDNSPRKCLTLSNILKQKSDGVLQRHHLVLSVYFSVANFYSFPNVYVYFSVLYFINSRN